MDCSMQLSHSQIVYRIINFYRECLSNDQILKSIITLHRDRCGGDVNEGASFLRLMRGEQFVVSSLAFCCVLSLVLFICFTISGF